MKLIEKIGSRVESINSNKTKQWGIFECPVCLTHVEKPLSHGRRNKSCGKQECRKATFTNANNKGYTGKSLIINGAKINSRNKLRFFNAFRAWYSRIDKSILHDNINTIEKAADEFYVDYEVAKLQYPNQSIGVSIIEWSKPLQKSNVYFTVESKSTGMDMYNHILKKLNAESGLSKTKIKDLLENTSLNLVKDYDTLLVEAVKLNYSHNKQTEYLYLISAGEFVKIGVAETPNNRLKEISVGCPYKPEIKAVKRLGKLCYLVERYLHIKYEKQCTNGEWFRLNTKDIEYIINTSSEELITTAALTVTSNRRLYTETTRVYNDEGKLNVLREEVELKYTKMCEAYEQQKADARGANEKPVIETIHEYDDRFAHDRTNQIKATTTHGMSKTEIYKAWQTMKKIYDVCEEWQSFNEFKNIVEEEFARLEESAKTAKDTPRVYPIEIAKPISPENYKIERVNTHTVKSAVARVVGQYDKEGNKVAEYNTITKAAEIVGCPASKISAVCKGKRKTSGGYIWKYEE